MIWHLDSLKRLRLASGRKGKPNLARTAALKVFGWVLRLVASLFAGKLEVT